jgi:hypothetical protein
MEDREEADEDWASARLSNWKTRLCESAGR